MIYLHIYFHLFSYSSLPYLPTYLLTTYLYYSVLYGMNGMELDWIGLDWTELEDILNFQIFRIIKEYEKRRRLCEWWLYCMPVWLYVCM